VSKPVEVKEKLTEQIPALYRFAIRLTKNATDAEDLLSDTIMKAIERLNSLDNPEKMKSWLFRIMNNRFIDEQRQKKNFRMTELPRESNEEDEFSLFEQLENSSIAEGDDPEKEFIHKLMDEDIKKAIDALPEDFRVAISLCDIEGFPYPDIAEILQIPIGTVRSRIARARALLQKKLWTHAKEMGIIKPRAAKDKKEILCDCGEPIENGNTDALTETQNLAAQ
jgi:RNA polymerase sigma-70 factor (ECF subfamily)